MKFYPIPDKNSNPQFPESEALLLT